MPLHGGAQSWEEGGSVSDETLVRFVDSGDASDEEHVVTLRGVGGNVSIGTIRGALPDSFVFDRTLFLRSGFTHRDEGGELNHTYYPAPVRRGVPRERIR
jgi:hypothetical protein